MTNREMLAEADRRGIARRDIIFDTADRRGAYPPGAVFADLEGGRIAIDKTKRGE